MIEHIYNLGIFFKTIQQMNPKMVSVFTTASNPANYFKVRALQKIQLKDEFEGGSPDDHALFGESPLEPFIKIREQIIRKYAEELPEKEIRIFPNPATTHITIDFDGIQGPVILELFNGQGQSVMKKSVSSGNSLSVGYLPRGLYMYRLYLQDNMKAGKILLN